MAAAAAAAALAPAVVNPIQQQPAPILSQVPPSVPPAPAPQHRAFKPYGSPPPFDLEAERDSFPIWEERWNRPGPPRYGIAINQ